LQLPVPLSNLPKPPGIRYTGDFRAIALRDWCQFLVDYNMWHLLVGLKKPDARRERAILAEFWKRYKLLYPQHQIWDTFQRHGVDPACCAPMLLHGDEGRGRKKAPFLVCAYHSMIGFGTLASNEARTRRPYLQMRLNYSGSSHLHRLLTAVLPKMHKDHVALQEICKFITADALHMVRCGVRSCHGGQYHMAVLSCTGDWAWLAKAGNLNRSYSNVEKRPRAANSVPKGICHYCSAGRENCPFEDFGRNPRWKATCFQAGDSPWTRRPIFLDIPHEPSRPAAWFTFDLWHCLHLGMGKVLCASAFALMSDRMSASNVVDRFSELSDLYMQWCDETRTPPFITSINKELIGWPDRSTFPNGYWSKGHITVTFIKFILFWLNNNDVSDCRMLTICRQAMSLLCEALEELYRESLWLDPDTARRIGEKGMKFMELYGKLVRIAYRNGQALWALMPKSHVVHHIFMECSEARCSMISPLAYAVQVSEDFIGKKSRLARRVGPQQVILRVLERTLVVTRQRWVEADFLSG